MSNEAPDTAPLDLIFLGTGKSQHVFVKTGDRDDGWVFKVPSMFGYLLPFSDKNCGFRSLFWNACCFLSVGVPHRLFAKGFLSLLRTA